MKPAPFDYVAPTTLPAALAALAEPGAVVLAGGQSLVLELVYRQHRPPLLVDLNRVPGLDHLDDGPDGLVVGALVRHADLEAGTGGSPARRLLRRVAPWVAHPPIRSRGTFVGSLAWAHPAAEWNALAAALDARVHLRSRDGDGLRVVAAEDWFAGERRTTRRPGELVTEVRFPPVPAGTGTGFAEHRRTHASFADVAVVAAVIGAGDRVDQLRLAVVGVADRPLRLRAVEQAAVGEGRRGLAERVRRALRQDPALPADPHRRGVAAELAGRAVAEAVAG